MKFSGVFKDMEDVDSNGETQKVCSVKHIESPKL